MEKIYMNNNKNTKNTKNNMKSPFVVSIGFSLFLFIALVITGLFQVSYAIPDIGKILPDTFISAESGNPKHKATGAVSQFVVNKFTTKDGDVVFCLERDVTYAPDVEYNKHDVINDTGLLYLMSNLYPNKKFSIGEQEIDERAQIWLSQSAIWIYLFECGYKNNTTLTPEIVEKIKVENVLIGESLEDKIIDLSSEDNMSLYKKFGITDLIEESKKLRNLKPNKLTINKESDEITISDDKKYYQTSLISVVGEVASTKIGSFKGFELVLNNAPKGTMVIDSNGKEIKDYTNLAPGTKFSFKIPADTLTNDNKRLKLTINGSFDSYFANGYVGYTSEGKASQKVTNVKKIFNNLNAPLEINIDYTPTVPDTLDYKSFVAIFIGVIMLVSGLGIFVANVKKN